jgi:site-specific DNA-cytosine methylase
MNVLSVFDGMSCGMLALRRLGIRVDRYFASEINKHAITVSKNNWFEIEHIGNVVVREFTEEILHFEMPKFNIHPSGKGMNGEVYSILKPKSNTLTTNKGEGQKVSVAFNQYVLSGRFSEWFATHADERIRKKYMSLDAMTARQFANWNSNFIFETLSEYIFPFDSTLKIIEKEVEQGKVGYFRKDSQTNRVYFIHGKSVTLCGDAGGGAAKMGQYLFGCITPNRVEKRQNGQRFNDGKKFYTLTANDSHGILIEGYIRKLTPIECERLQTVPDNYTGGVSDSQRYQMLGNGWTVDVICEFFKHLK